MCIRDSVTSGKITRTADIRVVRDGIVIAEDKVSSLKPVSYTHLDVYKRQVLGSSLWHAAGF